MFFRDFYLIVGILLVLCAVCYYRAKAKKKTLPFLNNGKKRRIPCFHVRSDCYGCMSQHDCDMQDENLLDEEEEE